MSLENPITPEAQFPLKYWFGKMNRVEQLTIETDLFNNSDDINLDTAFEKIQNQEISRQIMNLFQDYLKMKQEGSASKDELKSTVREIVEFIDRAAFPD